MILKRRLVAVHFVKIETSGNFCVLVNVKAKTSGLVSARALRVAETGLGKFIQMFLP